MSCACITQNGPCMPTSVPDHTRIRSSHFGHWNVLWIKRRWKPTEWPVHIVIASSRTNTPSALHEKKSGPSTRLAASMPPFQSERAGSQLTVPATGSTSEVSVSEATRNGSRVGAAAPRELTTSALAITGSRPSALREWQLAAHCDEAGARDD